MQPASPQVKPAPGLWIGRKQGAGIAWVNTSKLPQSAKNAQPPIGPNGEGEIVEIAFITEQLRWVPERQRHEGVVYFNNFFWVNYFLNI